MSCQDNSIQCYLATWFEYMFTITILSCKGEVILKKVTLLYVCTPLPSIFQASKCCGF